MSKQRHIKISNFNIISASYRPYGSFERRDIMAKVQGSANSELPVTATLASLWPPNPGAAATKHSTTI